MYAPGSDGEFQFFDALQKRPFVVPAGIIISSVIIVLLNIYGLLQGINVVLPHLFYIPIILAAYYYPRRGVPAAIVLSVCYCLPVFTLVTPSATEIASALARSVVFVFIGVVVSYLSGRMHHDTRMCRRLVSVVRSSGDAIIGATPEGIVTDWNRSAERLYGYTAAEMIGESIFRLIPPGLKEEETRLLERIRHGETIERIETERIRKDKTTVRVSLSLSPIIDSSGAITGVSRVAHDITERHQLQQEILKAKNRWEMTFDAVPDLIAIIDDKFRIVQVNRAMADRLGVSPEDAVGMHCYEVVHHTQNPVTLCPHQALLSDGRGHSSDIHEDNLNGDFHLTVSPLQDENGNVFGSVHILRDITERKQMEAALKGALQKLNTLSSITRHDILNQITGLRTFLELSREDLNGTRTAAYIEKGDQAAEAIQRQIEFTRYYQDIGVNAPVWQDAGEVIREAITQLHPPVTGHNGVSGIEIFADPLIVKVFFNLMENSLRHGERVTKMSFSSREMDGGLLITYEDDGVGISIEDKRRLFQKGFGKHTGLGLFLSREILAITGITITENGEPGKGARFEIAIPEGAWRIVKKEQ